VQELQEVQEAGATACFLHFLHFVHPVRAHPRFTQEASWREDQGAKSEEQRGVYPNLVQRFRDQAVHS
jgi:hypothetical protein